MLSALLAVSAMARLLLRVSLLDALLDPSLDLQSFFMSEAMLWHSSLMAQHLVERPAFLLPNRQERREIVPNSCTYSYPMLAVCWVNAEPMDVGCRSDDLA